MAFGLDGEDYMDRYTSREAALAGHAAAVMQVRARLEEDGQLKDGKPTGEIRDVAT
jgi:hypothetical protein